MLANCSIVIVASSRVMRNYILFVTVLGLLQVPLRAQPTITRQPTNQVLALGGTMTLSVTTSDPLAAYQWFKDSRLLLGATNSTLAEVDTTVVTNVTPMAPAPSRRAHRPFD